MKCERCNKREATIHISKLELGIQNTLNICEECAIQEGILYSYKPAVIESKKSYKKCTVCGLTEEAFVTKGLLGCSKCYEVFSDRIEQLISSLQGATCHRGKTPELSEPMTEFEEACFNLNEAIRSERYEDAAVWRDKIRGMKESTVPGKREEK